MEHSCRQFTIILNDQKMYTNALQMALALSKLNLGDVWMFAKHGIDVSEKNDHVIIMQPEIDTAPKMKNFVSQFFMDKYGAQKPFLHVFEDNVEILDGMREFVASIENVMRKLNYSIWLNTVCDSCNYVYQKYVPRISVDVDDKKHLENIGASKINFTSHCNTSYVVYDLMNVGNASKISFNEKFSIAMFYIIEFLARRRAGKCAHQLYYMNQYLSIPQEKNALRLCKNATSPQPPQDVFKAEDEIFKSLKLNYAPDNNIDLVLEDLYACMQSA